MLLATKETGWFWFEGKPINYDPCTPDGLPRSQDAMITVETTGLYAATRQVIMETGCRLGHRPLFYEIAREHALDIDTMDDLKEAQALLSVRGIQM